MYPPKLEAIINLFESLPEVERRETLVSYADNAPKQEPRPGETFVLEDIRKDEECADTVGVYLQVDEKGKAHFRMTLGPEVQTLTRAMTAMQSVSRSPAHGRSGVTAIPVAIIRKQTIVPAVIFRSFVQPRSRSAADKETESPD
jgi:cysteine desulfuration protein SufE